MSFSINENDYWELTETIPRLSHAQDVALATELVSFFKKNSASSIIDLGFGIDFYVELFKENELNASAFDGNPNTPDLRFDSCKILELSVPVKLDEPYDWVLSLDAGEHLPATYEDTFINNLHNNNKSGIVLSWGMNERKTYGVYNPQENDYIKSKICALGYTNDIESENTLRKSTRLPWFKKSIMVFRKNKN